MDTTTDAGTTDGGTAASPFEGATGNLDDIMSDLGLEPEGAESSKADAKVDAKSTAKGDEKAEKADESTTGDKPEADDKKETAAEEDPDLAELREVRARAKERKKAREDRASGLQAPAVAAKPEAPAAKVEAKVEPKADESKLSPEAREVAKATRDVLEQLARMTADDEAQTAKGGSTKAQQDARATEIAEVRSRLDKLTETLEKSNAGQEKLTSIEAKLKAAEDRQMAERAIDSTLDRMTSKLPILSSKRNAVSTVYAAAERFYERNGYAPDIAFLAEKVELTLKKQQGGEASTEKSAAKAGEKPAAKTKTASSSLSTPPASRKDPDKRSTEQVVADLAASLGLNPDDLR